MPANGGASIVGWAERRRIAFLMPPACPADTYAPRYMKTTFALLMPPACRRDFWGGGAAVVAASLTIRRASRRDFLGWQGRRSSSEPNDPPHPKGTRPAGFLGRRGCRSSSEPNDPPHPKGTRPAGFLGPESRQNRGKLVGLAPLGPPYFFASRRSVMCNDGARVTARSVRGGTWRRHPISRPLCRNRPASPGWSAGS